MSDCMYVSISQARDVRFAKPGIELVSANQGRIQHRRCCPEGNSTTGLSGFSYTVNDANTKRDIDCDDKREMCDVENASGQRGGGGAGGGGRGRPAGRAE